MIILTSFFNIPIKEILRHHHFRKEKRWSIWSIFFFKWKLFDSYNRYFNKYRYYNYLLDSLSLGLKYISFGLKYHYIGFLNPLERKKYSKLGKYIDHWLYWELTLIGPHFPLWQYFDWLFSPYRCPLVIFLYIIFLNTIVFPLVIFLCTILFLNTIVFVTNNNPLIYVYVI